METRSPTLGKVATMVVFTLSVVGLLLFLWLSFGGTIPLAARGYEFRVAFPNANQLADQADVRIAGVSVGKVVGKALDVGHNRTMVTIEMDNQFAPIRRDALAILRQKTILGETYVQLTPGTPGSPALRDGGMLARGQVTDEVQLSQIFNALDPVTRQAFRTWQQQMAKAVTGNDQNLNYVFGNLPTFAADATDLLRVLDIQHTAVVNLVRNGGTVFAALDRDPAALRALITSGEQTFATTAANNRSISAAIERFPGFLDQTRYTMARLESFAQDTDPLVRELEPVATQLKPTLTDVRRLAAPLRHFFVALGPLITASKTGLPAISDVLDGATPLLASLGPFLEQLNPILTWLSLHQQLIADFISNGAAGLAAKTTSFSGGGTGHYLRQFQPTGPETLSFAANRDPNNRGNTYPPPLWLANQLNFSAGGSYPGSFAFPSWDCGNTGAPGDGSKPAAPPTGPSQTATPACWVAPPLAALLHQAGKFPHLTAAMYSNR
ncbi:MAG: MlaD family protein [Solirubrobacteraceae bacterium]